MYAGHSVLVYDVLHAFLSVKVVQESVLHGQHRTLENFPTSSRQHTNAALHSLVCRGQGFVSSMVSGRPSCSTRKKTYTTLATIAQSARRLQSANGSLELFCIRSTKRWMTGSHANKERFGRIQRDRPHKHCHEARRSVASTRRRCPSSFT